MHFILLCFCFLLHDFSCFSAGYFQLSRKLDERIFSDLHRKVTFHLKILFVEGKVGLIRTGIRVWLHRIYLIPAEESFTLDCLTSYLEIHYQGSTWHRG
jgi:hypothetical protein